MRCKRKFAEVDSTFSDGQNVHMAEVSKAPTVKLICGMICSCKDLFDLAERRMGERFGPVDLRSDLMNFDFTHYYDAEMGTPLYRKFVSFQKLIDPEELIEAKRHTNRLEEQFASKSNLQVSRPINLDPGYIEESKLVLGSMKNFSHRIYLGSGVYGEITLMYQKGKWKGLNWTFPDYGSGRYNSFLTAVRDKLRKQCSSRESQTC